MHGVTNIPYFKSALPVRPASIGEKQACTPPVTSAVVGSTGKSTAPLQPVFSFCTILDKHAALSAEKPPVTIKDGKIEGTEASAAALRSIEAALAEMDFSGMTDKQAFSTIHAEYAKWYGREFYEQSIMGASWKDRLENTEQVDALAAVLDSFEGAVLRVLDSEGNMSADSIQYELRNLYTAHLGMAEMEKDERFAGVIDRYRQKPFDYASLSNIFRTLLLTGSISESEYMELQIELDVVRFQEENKEEDSQLLATKVLIAFYEKYGRLTGSTMLEEELGDLIEMIVSQLTRNPLDEDDEDAPQLTRIANKDDMKFTSKQREMEYATQYLRRQPVYGKIIAGLTG